MVNHTRTPATTRPCARPAHDTASGTRALLVWCGPNPYVTVSCAQIAPHGAPRKSTQTLNRRHSDGKASHLFPFCLAWRWQITDVRLFECYTFGAPTHAKLVPTGASICWRRMKLGQCQHRAPEASLAGCAILVCATVGLVVPQVCAVWRPWTLQPPYVLCSHSSFGEFVHGRPTERYAKVPPTAPSSSRS